MATNPRSFSSNSISLCSIYCMIRSCCLRVPLLGRQSMCGQHEPFVFLIIPDFEGTFFILLETNDDDDALFSRKLLKKL